MKVIGIVPARAGSTAVKNKNIRLLNNQPLLSYAINTGLNSSLDRVILSTDSPEYQEIGKKYNAETPFLRPNGSVGLDLQPTLRLSYDAPYVPAWNAMSPLK